MCAWRREGLVTPWHGRPDCSRRATATYIDQTRRMIEARPLGSADPRGACSQVEGAGDDLYKVMKTLLEIRDEVKS